MRRSDQIPSLSIQLESLMPITILGLLREGEFFSPFILSYYVLLLLGVIPNAHCDWLSGHSLGIEHCIREVALMIYIVY